MTLSPCNWLTFNKLKFKRFFCNFFLMYRIGGHRAVKSLSCVKKNFKICITLWYLFKAKKYLLTFCYFLAFFQPSHSTQTVKVVDLGVNTSSLWEKACNRLANVFRTRAATLFTVNKNGFTPFANSRCQSLLQTMSMGSHPLLMVDVKVYYSQHEWAHTLC